MPETGLTRMIGEYISILIGGENIDNSSLAQGYIVMHELNVDFNTLGTLMLCWLARHVDSANVTTLHR